MNGRKQKALISGILIGGLLAAVASFLAQTPKTDQPSSQPASQVFPEKEREQTNLHRITGLLSRFGVHVGPALPASDGQRYRELRINWESIQKTGTAELFREDQLSAAGVLTQIASTPREGALPRERSLELSTDRLLVVALDESDAVRWWKLMIDPRLVRAEVGRSEEMRSENLYMGRVDFNVECPDDSLLKQLKFFRLVWNGESFQLELVGAVPLQSK